MDWSLRCFQEDPVNGRTPRSDTFQGAGEGDQTYAQIGTFLVTETGIHHCCDLSLAPTTMMWTCFSLLRAGKKIFILCLETGSLRGGKMKKPLEASFYLIHPSENWDVVPMASLTQTFWHVWSLCLFFRPSKRLVTEQSTHWGSVPVRNDNAIPAFPLVS